MIMLCAPRHYRRAAAGHTKKLAISEEHMLHARWMPALSRVAGIPHECIISSHISTLAGTLIICILLLKQHRAARLRDFRHHALMRAHITRRAYVGDAEIE